MEKFSDTTEHKLNDDRDLISVLMLRSITRPVESSNSN